MMDSIAGLPWGGSPTVAAWLLTYAIHSTLLLGGVWLVTRPGTMADVLQDLLWKVALVGGVATATVQVGAGWRMQLATGYSATVGQPASATMHRPAAPVAFGAASNDRLSLATDGVVSGPAEIEGISRSPAAATAHGPMAAWTAWVFAIWAGGAALMLLRLGFARVRLARRLHGRSPVPAGQAVRQLEELWRAAGIRRAVRLTCSARVGAPLALGSGEICVPPRVLSALNAEQQESILAHELAHLVRRDPHWLAAAAVLEAVFFFQPLNRLARRRMQEVAEYLCDDWAVRQTRRGVVLARCLAEVAGWRLAAPSALPLAGMAERRSTLALRVERLLAGPSRPELRLPWGGRVAIAAGALLLVGCFAPRVSVDPPARPGDPGDEPSPTLPAPAEPARLTQLDEPVAIPMSEVNQPPYSYCWSVDGLPANPHCTVTIRTLAGAEFDVGSDQVHRLGLSGRYRVEERGGVRVRRMSVRALERNWLDPERVAVLLIEVPPEVPDASGLAEAIRIPEVDLPDRLPW